MSRATQDPLLSIIMPVLNEAAGLAATLAPLQRWRARGAELVIVDGGSTDGSRALAAAACDRLLEGNPGRALQMNAGAAASSGRLLIFLHADTALPDGAQAVLEELADRTPVWGRFDITLAGSHCLLPLVAWLMNWRSRLTAVATGDQAIFVSRALFERCGGFPALPLMEDIALTKRLRRHLQPVCLRQRVQSSGRRWERDGVLKTILLMWGLRLGYFLGFDPARLARWYRHVR